MCGGGVGVVGVVFFFQAEDGIRDVAVTGVQTCALPILSNINLNVNTTVVSTKEFATRSIRYVHQRQGATPLKFKSCIVRKTFSPLVGMKA